MKRYLICSICLMIVVSLFPLKAMGAGPEYVMKVSIGNPEKDYYHGWSPFLVFKNEAEARSGGRLKVELLPLILGKSTGDELSVVKEGVVQARDFADGHFASTYPPIQVLSIPYLFENREIAWKVLDGPFGESLIEEMARKTGLRPLYWMENGGFRHYSNNTRRVRTPADMKGLKIRTMESLLHMKIVSDLGGRAIPIEWAEVYEALEAGIVNGQENSISTFLLPKFEKVQKFVTLDAHVYSTYALLMNDKWYRNLPVDLQEVIQVAGRISLVVNRGLSITNEVMGLEYLRSKGVDVYIPTRAEKAEWKRITQQSGIQWLKKNIGREWVDAVLKATLQAERDLDRSLSNSPLVTE
jgi:TRAP-type transport system periplasmic protein